MEGAPKSAIFMTPSVCDAAQHARVSHKQQQCELCTPPDLALSAVSPGGRITSLGCRHEHLPVSSEPQEPELSGAVQTSGVEMCVRQRACAMLPSSVSKGMPPSIRLPGFRSRWMMMRLLYVSRAHATP